MAPEAGPQVTSSPAGADEELRRTLGRLVETHGRAICREPQRLEAMLRDLCPHSRREIFLLAAAVREQVVSEMLHSVDVLPDDIVVARGARKLCDTLGLSEESARWAIESWLPASRLMAAMPDLPPKFEIAPAVEAPDEVPEDTGAPAFDWRWIALCAAAIVCAAAGIAVTAYLAFHHPWNSLAGWLLATGLLGGGLAVSGISLAAVARGMRRMSVPNHRALPAGAAASAMLLDVAVLLVLPLVPVATVALWAGEWALELHLQGAAHDLSFHLGRILQSLVLAVYLYFWGRIGVRVQGRIASSMVRSR